MTESTKNTPKVVFLQGKKTVLRPLTREDLPILVQYINDPEIRRFVTMRTSMTLDDENAWFDSLLRGAPKYRSDFVFIIEADGKVIGDMGLHSIDYVDQTCVTGAMIGEKEYRGKGYGTDAKMQMLHYAFTELNMRKVCSEVLETNPRSQAYLKKQGYQIEGVRKKQILKGGEFRDLLLVALFKDDFMSIWEEYNKE